MYADLFNQYSTAISHVSQLILQNMQHLVLLLAVLLIIYYVHRVPENVPLYHLL